MNNSIGKSIKKYLRLLLISLCAIFIIAALSIVYEAIVHDSVSFRYVFDANFLVGVIVTLGGIVVMFLPVAFFTKLGNSLDRFTYMQRRFDNRENSQKKARVVLWLGLFIIILAGLIEILVSIIT